MPSRVIRDGINRSASLARVSIGAELFFRALLNACDDFGRMEARPEVLRATVMPLRVDGISVADVREWLDELSHSDDPARHPGASGPSCLHLYTVNGVEYLCFPRWEQHRSNSKRATRSRCPAPPEPGEWIARGVAPPPASGADQNSLGLIGGSTGSEEPADPPGPRGSPRGPARGDEVTRCRGSNSRAPQPVRSRPPEALALEVLLTEFVVARFGAYAAPRRRGSWAAHFERLAKKGCTYARQEEMIRWCYSEQNPEGSYRVEVRSGRALLEKVSTVEAAMARAEARTREGGRSTGGAAIRRFWDGEEGERA